MSLGVLPDRNPDLQLCGLSIWTFSRRALADNFWDGNFLDSLIRVDAGGASVEIRGSSPTTPELADFLVELERAHRTLSGEAALIFTDAGFSARASFGGTGHVRLEVEITPNLMSQKHWFLFETDQSFFPPVLASCREILRKYPVVINCETVSTAKLLSEKYGRFSDVDN